MIAPIGTMKHKKAQKKRGKAREIIRRKEVTVAEALSIARGHITAEQLAKGRIKCVHCGQLPFPERKRGQPTKAIAMPDGTRYTKQQFKDEQNKWYAKLKSEGFKDLEWTDEETGIGQNSPYLKHNDSNRQSVYAGSQLNYTRLAENYFRYEASSMHPEEFLVWKLHVQGLTFRKIVSEYNKTFTIKQRSLFYVFKIYEALKAKCLQWNKQSRDGLLYEGPKEFEVLDVPLGNFRGILKHDEQ